MRRPVIALAGPTASGKSALAVELAVRVGGEVVGADSVQVYRGFEIGAGTLPQDQRRGVPHHLIGVADGPMTAGRWRSLAVEAIEAIRRRGRVAIVCGGTGLYHTVLQRGLAAIPPPDPARRAALARLPLEDLVRRLRALDPAADLDLRNPRRVARAIEIVEATGRPLAEARGGGPPPFPLAVFVLDVPAGALDERIAARVRAIYREGLVDETRRLLAHWPADAEPMRAVGYREAVAVIEGRLDPGEAIEETIRSTRRLARRQRTWFRHQVDGRLIAPEAFVAAAEALC